MSRKLSPFTVCAFTGLPPEPSLAPHALPLSYPVHSMPHTRHWDTHTRVTFCGSGPSVVSVKSRDTTPSIVKQTPKTTDVRYWWLPSKAVRVLVLPVGVYLHGLVALPVLYETKDSQFTLCLINANETPVRPEQDRSATIWSHAHTPDSNSPSDLVTGSPLLSVIPPVDIEEVKAVLQCLFNAFPQWLPSPEHHTEASAEEGRFTPSRCWLP